HESLVSSESRQDRRCCCPQKPGPQTFYLAKWFASQNCASLLLLCSRPLSLSTISIVRASPSPSPNLGRTFRFPTSNFRNCNRCFCSLTRFRTPSAAEL